MGPKWTKHVREAGRTPGGKDQSLDHKNSGTCTGVLLIHHTTLEKGRLSRKCNLAGDTNGVVMTTTTVSCLNI